ncbi:hypothetical protein FNT36_03200 [Hymenobacter setariae]|uniref:Uncharacterized protein n=1 Tax=Hymenobacter setariae TaxID=2594794 RepID=A0A558C2U2_9BACT|nr:hypothetical protein [Hymenobacter setariae]TVT43113.1 hypothetical protein FNT36_03200 [Hymenobacter setariae]
MSQTAEQKAAKEVEKAQKEAEKAAKEAADKQNQLESGEKAAETQKIKFLRSHPRYGYWPGDTADLAAEHVELLTSGGFAELVAAPETESENEE